MADPVLYAVADGIATITLNRPERLNALNPALRDGLVDAVERVDRDPAVRVVVLKGAGDGFMAGGDVIAFGEPAGLASELRRQHFARSVAGLDALVVGMRRLPVPVIASLHGAVAGFGLSLAIAADLAVAAEDAFFTLAYSRIGLSPDGGATWTLPRLVGLKKAMEMALLGDRFDAAAALRLGIVNEVVPAAEREARVAAPAARLAAGPARAYAETKRLLYAGQTATIETQLRAEGEAFSGCAATDDFVEGVRAFAEKRQPRFTGR
jgi:2-(1,2-epoxy-1,2-dihydrophenyl)acetyl-CoA isomerase